MALRVFPHGVVELVVPLRTGRRSVEEFLRSHAEWIAKARRHFQASAVATAFAPPEEIHLVALGEHWLLRYLAGNPRLKEVPVAGGGELQLRGPDSGDWRRLRLRRWLLARGRATLVPWLALVSKETGLRFSRVTVRRQRSRWGSCSASGGISLNCALLFLEPALVRYLFVHELAHTEHLNHSRAFWRCVERLEPEFEALEARRGQEWRAVPAWVSYDLPGPGVD
jgi:predicted metal-dependent hydrolase